MNAHVNAYRQYLASKEMEFNYTLAIRYVWKILYGPIAGMGLSTKEKCPSQRPDGRTRSVSQFHLARIQKVKGRRDAWEHELMKVPHDVQDFVQSACLLWWRSRCGRPARKGKPAVSPCPLSTRYACLRAIRDERRKNKPYQWYGKRSRKVIRPSKMFRSDDNFIPAREMRAVVDEYVPSHLQGKAIALLAWIASGGSLRQWAEKTGHSISAIQREWKEIVSFIPDEWQDDLTMFPDNPNNPILPIVSGEHIQPFPEGKVERSGTMVRPQQHTVFNGYTDGTIVIPIVCDVLPSDDSIPSERVYVPNCWGKAP